MMPTNVSKRGVALIWTLITISILLIVSTTMANYIIRESKMSVRIEDSTKAYSIAQSGIEWSQIYISTHPALVAEYKTGFAMLDGTVSIVIEPPVLDNTTVTSEGVYNGVGRKLQYVIGKDSFKNVANTNVMAQTMSTTDQSYGYQFDFSMTNSGEIVFGLTNNQAAPLSSSVGLRTLAVKATKTVDKVDFSIDAWKDNQITYVPMPIYSALKSDSVYELPENPYAFRLKVDYLQGTAARLIVYRRSVASGLYICVDTMNLDMTPGSYDLSMSNASFFANPSLTLGNKDYKNNLLLAGNAVIDNVYVRGMTTGVVTTPVVPPATNLLTNGDFSSGSSSWNVVNLSGGPWNVISDGGNNVMAITRSSSNWNAFGQDMRGKMTSNTTYTLTFRYKAAPGSTATADYFRISDGSLIQASQSVGSYTLITDGSWHNGTMTFSVGTFPINFTAYGPWQLYMFGIHMDQNENGTYYFDDLNLSIN